MCYKLKYYGDACICCCHRHLQMKIRNIYGVKYLCYSKNIWAKQ